MSGSFAPTPTVVVVATVVAAPFMSGAADLRSLFYAFDGRTGQQLFTCRAPRSSGSSPLTPTAGDRQYVTVVATNNGTIVRLP